MEERRAHGQDGSYSAARPAGNRAKRKAMHPSNKYAERPPDFNLLASLYPSFNDYVSLGPNKKPRIDWTDFNATRELTRVLLEHDFGIKWWVPDGQLCPTVTSRANYIHWVDDLLAASPAPWHADSPTQIRGVDIGTGANCIYALLGAALHGWHFVATDITPVALEWAQKNVQDNPEYSEYIHVRRAGEDLTGEVEAEVCMQEKIGINTLSTNSTPQIPGDEEGDLLEVDGKFSHSNERPISKVGSDESSKEETGCLTQDTVDVLQTAPVLCGVLREDERFDFCMCNPPFFESIEEAGLNPRTACGGTTHEMVYPGGELAFILRIIKDSVQLGRKIQWYTSMVGRKVNIKILTAKLRAVGVTMLRTTEFVQGRTSRWGIAWSFSPAQKVPAVIPGRSVGRSKVSFMLEGIESQFSAVDVLQALADHLRSHGAATTMDMSSFSLTGTFSADSGEPQDLKNLPTVRGSEDPERVTISPSTASDAIKNDNLLSFQASVFQQVPGTLLIKASLPKAQPSSVRFSTLFEQVELGLKKKFLKTLSRR